MRRALRAKARVAIAAAASLTGKRFGLLVASSLVATSAIVAAALTNPNSGVGPLAGLLGRSLAANTVPTASPNPPAVHTPSGPSPAPESAPSPAPSASGSPAPAPAPAPKPTPETSAAPIPETPAPPAPEPGPVKHVFMISLTSPGYEAAFGTASQMPYLSGTLRPQGELLSGYSLLDDEGLANDLATVSGQAPTAATKQGCPSFDECVFPVETTTIADQLTAAGLGWRAYMEGMTDPATGKPGSCVYPGAGEPYPPAEGGYTPTANPFVYFHSLLDLGDCAADDVSLDPLSADLVKKADGAPGLSYVSPTLCNAGAIAECPAGEAGGPAAPDAFLAEWVPKILASPAYKDQGLLVVTFDRIEAPPAADGTPAPPPASSKVGALVVSPIFAPGSTDPKSYDPYSMLRSLEDLLGLTHLGAADGKKVRSFAAGLEGGSGD